MHTYKVNSLKEARTKIKAAKELGFASFVQVFGEIGEKFKGSWEYEHLFEPATLLQFGNKLGAAEFDGQVREIRFTEKTKFQVVVHV